jgi:hypothetical protein
MGALAGFIGSLMGGTIGWIAKYFGKRVAVTAAVIAAFTVATGVMWAALEALTTGLAMALPGPLVAAAGWLNPSNVEECFAAIYTADFIRFVYDTKVRVLDFKGRV